MIQAPIKSVGENTQLSIRVTPKASKSYIGDIMDVGGEPSLKVYVTDIPENGKANEAVLKLLSKELSVSKGDLEIVFGTTDRNKKILIKLPFEEVSKKLQLALNLLF